MVFIGVFVIIACPYTGRSWIYNYLCNQCLSPLTLWVRTLLRRGVLNTTLCDKVCQWLAAGQCFSLGTPVSSTNKTDCHDITETLNTINPLAQIKSLFCIYYDIRMFLSTALNLFYSIVKVVQEKFVHQFWRIY